MTKTTIERLSTLQAHMAALRELIQKAEDETNVPSDGAYYSVNALEQLVAGFILRCDTTRATPAELLGGSLSVE